MKDFIEKFIKCFVHDSENDRIMEKYIDEYYWDLIRIADQFLLKWRFLKYLNFLNLNIIQTDILYKGCDLFRITDKQLKDTNYNFKMNFRTANLANEIKEEIENELENTNEFI